jgi:glucose-1-phosphate adenylyltransferase
MSSESYGREEACFEANMDLRAVSQSIDLYNKSRPIQTLGYGGPPPKFVFDEASRTGVGINSIDTEGTIISGSRIDGSVIGQNMGMHSYCHRGGRSKNAIIDKFNALAPGTEIGYDHETDRERYSFAGVGITMIPRAAAKN